MTARSGVVIASSHELAQPGRRRRPIRRLHFRRSVTLGLLARPVKAVVATSRSRFQGC